MGKYVERNSFGRLSSGYVDKLKELVLDGASVISGTPSEWTTDLICVVDNGPWAAAGYCYDEKEFKRWTDSFANGDTRRHIWMIYPKVKEYFK